MPDVLWPSPMRPPKSVEPKSKLKWWWTLLMLLGLLGFGLFRLKEILTSLP